MGVKTLHPSDYALVSSVTKHFSGVQLLPTVSGGREGTNSNFWTDGGIVDMECIMREANSSVFRLSRQIS